MEGTEEAPEAMQVRVLLRELQKTRPVEDYVAPYLCCYHNLERNREVAAWKLKC